MAELRERLHIAVGVILDQATDKVLVARRPGHVHLGGLLEFPGGKLDPGEDVRNALSRELREELNISVTRARQLIQIKYDYPGESVLLDVWLVTDWGGTPKGMEGQEIMWIRKNALAKSEFPDANQQIITAINLPPVYGITPDLADYGDEFYGRLAKILEKGLRLIQFRSKRLDAQSKRRTLRRIYKLCNEFNCRILINGIADADMLDSAHGLHLTSSDLNSLHERPPGENLLVAASCHSSEEIEQACRLGVDFCGFVSGE